MIDPRIEVIDSKLLIGLCLDISLTENKTFELWSSFMPRLKEVENRVDQNLISLQVYNQNLAYADFTPLTKFTKWASVEVNNTDNIPEGMREYLLPAGTYAVFIHHGLPELFPKTNAFIHKMWLPNSKYELDNRPHFEVLGKNYKNNDPNSEEEIWVPVKLKHQTN